MPPPGVKVREGYELWHPNQEKAESKTTKAIVAIVLLISAALLVIITLGGWDKLQSPGVGIMTIAWAGLYVLFALLVLRWNRGVLPVASAMAIIMVIFAAVAAGGWFARAKDGLNSPALPEELLGLLTIIVIPVQILLIAVAMVGFNQAWNVEEERPIGGRPPPDTPPDDGAEAESEAASNRGGAAAARRQSRESAERQAIVEDDDPDWADGPQTSPAV
jgi:hypothetical protein